MNQKHWPHREAVLGDGRLKDWFWFGGLSRITDADTTVRADEHIPRVYAKTEERFTVRDAIRRFNQLVKGVRVNVIEQRWEVSRFNTDSVRQSGYNSLCSRAIILEVVFRINDRSAYVIDQCLSSIDYGTLTHPVYKAVSR